LSSLVRHPLGAAAQRPSKLRETNHRGSYSTSDGAQTAGFMLGYLFIRHASVSGGVASTIRYRKIAALGRICLLSDA